MKSPRFVTYWASVGGKWHAYETEDIDPQMLADSLSVCEPPVYREGQAVVRKPDTSVIRVCPKCWEFTREGGLSE